MFGERFDAIAATMDRSVESCRQLASRARRKLHDADEQRRDEHRAAAAVAERFLVALATGDAATAVACLAPDAVYLSDGGPDRHAARRPVRVPERIVRLLANVYGRMPPSCEIAPAWVGGCPGLVVTDAGRTLYTLSCEVVDAMIVRITTILNPAKLTALDRAPTAIE